MKQLKITSSITSRESRALEKYLQEIGKMEMLTPEEEVALARRIKQGDEKAMEELTKGNLRFVVSVAKKYVNQGMSLNDLINEGNVGLIKATRRFDETRGFKFISYAVWWIRQSIMQALVEQSRAIRLPLNKIDSYQRIQRALAQFLQQNERQPSIEEVMEITQLSEKEVTELLKIDYKPISLDTPLDASDEAGDTMVNNLEDKGEDKPDSELNAESLRGEIYQAMQILTPREFGIIESFYGLNGQPAMSLEAVGQKFDLTQERVRQIKERAIRRLRKTSISETLKIYLG
ncbi:MAG: sigma-70 family RNA polymerase sigma factor [Chitinophagales bacterium]|jgi:RNA polymerase primary sigma factor|nr:sigma-70 family RNA polymerase sigma factor [Sphingobacteriales bacterium]MBP6664594.1 sigma-70 family RNA polymerase sigma factor [Chitinophagales bacterium]MBP7534316.1 sigma-70 family RNA polymerase sigma factor [Chitinophagales bacterium]